MYIKKIYIAGVTIEIEKTYSTRYGKKIARSKNMNPTPEDVKKVNEKRAEDKLRRLINNNFEYKDIHLVLTYKKELRPDPEQAKKIFAKFLRNLRKEYKKREIELKYITTTEYEGKSIHHHLIINKIDVGIFSDLWPYGRPHTTLLDSSGDYSALAFYFIKETKRTFNKDNAVFKQRYSCSKNLIPVEPIVELVKANEWRSEPKAIKGYYLIEDSVQNFICDVTGFPQQRYRMIAINMQRC